VPLLGLFLFLGLQLRIFGPFTGPSDEHGYNSRIFQSNMFVCFLFVFVRL